MATLADFLNGLGGLHDAKLTSMRWDVDDRSLTLVFDDLYANFRGLPAYPGKRQGTLVFRGVKKIEMDAPADETLKVFELLPLDGQRDKIIAKLSPAGSIMLEFDAVDYPSSELRS